MFSKIKFAAASALIALGSLAAIPSTASAGDIDVDVYLGGGYGPRYDEPYRPRPMGPRHGGGFEVGIGFGDGWDRDYRPTCSPRLAEAKARSMGLRRTYIADAGRRGIVVKGRKWGETHTVVFGRAPNCPVRSVW